MARRHMSGFVPSWATANPWTMGPATPAVGKNLVGGKWMETAKQEKVIDPLNGEVICLVPDTQRSEIDPFVERMRNCPRSGLHNPLKNTERYNQIGEVMVKAAHELRKPEVIEFYAKLIQRLIPKSWPQCMGEPVVTRKWMENYGSDQARMPECRLLGPAPSLQTHAAFEPRRWNTHTTPLCRRVAPRPVRGYSARFTHSDQTRRSAGALPRSILWDPGRSHRPDVDRNPHAVRRRLRNHAVQVRASSASEPRASEPRVPPRPALSGRFTPLHLASHRTCTDALSAPLRTARWAPLAWPPSTWPATSLVWRSFPLEICALQTLSALFMGNQPLCKVDSKVAIVMEQFIRMLHHAGLQTTDVRLLAAACSLRVARGG